MLRITSAEVGTTAGEAARAEDIKLVETIELDAVVVVGFADVENSDAVVRLDVIVDTLPEDMR